MKAAKSRVPRCLLFLDDTALGYAFVRARASTLSYKLANSSPSSAIGPAADGRGACKRMCGELGVAPSLRIGNRTSLRSRAVMVAISRSSALTRELVENPPVRFSETLL